LPPPFGGWWNVKGDEPGGYLGYALDFHGGGRRYEPGTIPIAQIIGLAAALDLLAEMGQPAIRERVLTVTTALAAGLSGCGGRVPTPAPLGSGILAAVPPDGDDRRAAKELERRGIITAPRQKAIRFSPHAYNDEDEVARVLEAIDALGSS